MQLSIYHMVPKKDDTWKKYQEIKKAWKYALDYEKRLETLKSNKNEKTTDNNGKHKQKR